MMKKRALDQISTAFDQAGMKLVAKRLSFSVSPETQNQCTLQVSGNTLRQSSNFTESRNRSYNVSPCVQNAPEKISEASPDGYTYGEAKTTSPTLFGLVLVWSQQKYLRSLKVVLRHFGSS